MLRKALLLITVFSGVSETFGDSAIAAGANVNAPMAIEDVLDARSAEMEGGITFSPDSAWVTQVFQTARMTYLDGGNWRISGTGVSKREGEGVRRLRITNLHEGKKFDLGSGDVSTWGPSWSPDGKQMAYYSDEGGEAGLWVWTVATRTPRRVGKIIARSGFTFELPLWIDNHRVVAKVLPAGTTVSEANLMAPNVFDNRKLPPPPRDETASVSVLSSELLARAELNDNQIIAADDNLAFDFGEIALVDTATGEAKHLTSRTSLRGYSLSPDRRWLTYAFLKGAYANAHRPAYEIRLIDLQNGSDRILVPNAALGYGNEYSWSPDSSRLALIMADKSWTPQLTVVNLTGESTSFASTTPVLSGTVNTFQSNSFAEWPPLWGPDGQVIYAIVNGALWQFDPATGESRQTAQTPGFRLLRITTLEGTGLIHGNEPDAMLVVAQDEVSKEIHFLQINLLQGTHKSTFRAGQRSVVAGNLAVANSGAIAFLMADATKLPDLWHYDPRLDNSYQISHLNPQLDRYQLGKTRLVRWTSASGKAREGLLMLPPQHKPGTPLPLFVFVYGSDTNVGRRVHHYSLGWGAIPMYNFHMLTTRGYAVFYPDLPLELGESIASFMDSLDPGLDMLIKQGIADPDRMAIAGQSYGSYTTWSVISQTTRFKAAITTANVLHPDLIAGYLRLGPDGTPIATGYYEKGQGNMGGTPWDQRERYLKNSPVTYLDRIQTPLLMGQGSLDGLTASDALYAGLLRLGKTVEYRIYPGEGHVISFRGNVRDFWQRQLEFLDQHLGAGKSQTTQ
jgi:dipeptidyl aminopeptidase/acylaminoacyl peptidase